MLRELTFQPGTWHVCQKGTWKDCADGVNCYSYALNAPRYYWSVPGFGYQKTKPLSLSAKFDQFFAGYSLDEFCTAMVEGAVRDGLVQTENMRDREGCYLTALFFSDRLDRRNFHWYRKDDNGFWSHKDRWRKPANRTPEGNPIYDPRANPPVEFPIFGGFFLVPSGGITLTEGYRLDRTTPHTPLIAI